MLADGTVVPSMAELMKDNAGYDVKQLFVGSEGTLGVATRMMVHLHPALAVRHSAMVAALDVRGLVALLRSARHWSGPRLTSFEASWREDEEHAVAATATRLPLEFDHGCYALLEAETSDGAGAGDRLEELPGSSLAAGAIEDAVIAQSLGESATLWRIRDTVAEVTGALTPWPHTTFRCPWSLWLHAGGLASRGGANPAVRVRGRPPMHRGRRRPRGFRPIRFEKSACLSDDSTAPFATPRSPGGRGGGGGSPTESTGEECFAKLLVQGNTRRTRGGFPTDSTDAIIHPVQRPRIVLDTNVLVAAFTSGRGASREVLRRLLRKDAQPLISVPLFTEYEDVLARPEVQRRCRLSSQEQQALFDAFLACTELVEVYYRWRPNLPDESDNHVLELAVAAGSATILTFNRQDFSRGELRFPDVAIQSPAHWLKTT